MSVNLIVSCASGVEDLLADELNELGYASSPAKRGKLRLSSCTSEDIVRLNFHLRQASLKKAGYEIKHVWKLLYGRLKVCMIKAGH